MQAWAPFGAKNIKAKKSESRIGYSIKCYICGENPIWEAIVVVVKSDIYGICVDSLVGTNYKKQTYTGLWEN